MTQEEIIRMARDCGGIADDQTIVLYHNELERFAAIVTAHERRKFMDLCEAEYKAYDELVTEEDVGHEEATAIIHLMRKLEGIK